MSSENCIEGILKHKYRDIYRIKEGVLLVVDKYRNNLVLSDGLINKENSVKVDGIQNCYRTIKAIKDWRETIPEGSIILDDWSITPVERPEEFRIALKFSGGAYHGSICEYRLLSQAISQILSSY